MHPQTIMTAGHGGNSGRFQSMLENAEVNAFSQPAFFFLFDFVTPPQVFAFAVWAIQWSCGSAP
jgi:hypothetical protein